jgi:uncharacterized coiled-coil protein SlyX
MSGNGNGRRPQEERLATLETRYVALHDDVQGLRNDFSHFASEIRATLTDMRRTPWGDMAKWASVVVSVIALIGGLIAYGLNSRIDSLHEEQKFRQRSVYSLPLVSERVNNNRKDIEGLDTVLQREMRLLDTGLRNELDGAIENLQKQHDLLLNEFHDHQNLGFHPDARELIGRLDERIKALEQATRGN